MAKVEDITGTKKADEPGGITCLDFLLAGAEAPVVGQFSIAGQIHELRNVDILEDFLIVVEAGDELAKLDGRNHGELTRKREEILGRLWQIAKALSPTLSDDLLSQHFSKIAEATRLVVELRNLAWKAASPTLKKN